MTAEIFPKHPTADAYYIGGSWTPYAIVGVDKRFTGAELAAEWHANEVHAWWMLSYLPKFYDVARAQRLEARSDILRRFATLPHYDEAGA